MKKRRVRRYKVTRSKLNRILQKKYDELRRRNPTLNEAELETLFFKKQKEFAQRKKAKAEKSEGKKRAKSRERSAEKGIRGRTGQSIRTVSGGRVSPR